MMLGKFVEQITLLLLHLELKSAHFYLLFLNHVLNLFEGF